MKLHLGKLFMQEETKNWLTYSEENPEAAKILLESELYNPCLHNIQQSIEKALKSLFIEKVIPFKKTHNIMELKKILEKNGISIELTEDECDFLVPTLSGLFTYQISYWECTSILLPR